MNAAIPFTVSHREHSMEAALYYIFIKKKRNPSDGFTALLIHYLAHGGSPSELIASIKEV